jgi:murein DD-endopeptidase MepM/ murein hydrolase activator NlpD
VGACGHEGIDFAVKGGTPILSDGRGRVVFAGLTQVRGNLVVVDHGLGVYSAYYHQSALAVSVGQMVEAGDLIGKVGTTGLSTGDHLHWSLFVNGQYVDPFEWTRRVFP